MRARRGDLREGEEEMRSALVMRRRDRGDQGSSWELMGAHGSSWELRGDQLALVMRRRRKSLASEETLSNWAGKRNGSSLMRRFFSFASCE